MIVDLPIIINGEIINDGERYEFEYETGLVVTIPKLTSEHIKKMKEADTEAVHNMTITEVSEYLGKVGDLWKNLNYPIRKECIKYASLANGYSEEMLEFDTLNIPELLVRPYIGDMLDVELGDRNLLDEWERRGSSIIHCEPLGKLLHIMVGNVPIASIYSLVRGIMTKNVNLVKLPRRDLFTCLYFAMSMLEADKDNPISKNLSVFTWCGGKEDVEEEVINISDGVCVWGGESAVSSIRDKVPYGKRLMIFGPRKSIQIVGDISDDEMKTGTDSAARDIGMYDQEACFSTQVIYVKCDENKYAQSLAESLNEFGKKYPKGFMTKDHKANVQFVRDNASFEGKKVICPNDTEWTIIVSSEMMEVKEHPLSRTVYVIKINDYDEILPFINKYSQTAAVYPEKLRYEIRDMLTIRGIDRVIESGKTWEPRLGSPHDGMYAMHDMVRWVCMDRESEYQSRYYDKINYYEG